jgi:hypothetical protein
MVVGVITTEKFYSAAAAVFVVVTLLARFAVKRLPISLQ